MKKTLSWPILILAFLLASCSAYKEGHDYLGFNIKDFERSFVLIPKTSIPNPALYDTTKRVFNSFKESTIEADSFYIFPFEISNGGYIKFLRDLYKKDTNLYYQMLPDQEVWRSKFEFNEPLVNYYFRHPGYQNHPVVGITYEQAEAYCIWLSEEYSKIKNRIYKNVTFKLPTKSQWFIAAIGKDLKNKFFPWPGNSLQNTKGEWLANFRVINQIQIRKDTGFIYCHNSSSYLENCFVIGNRQDYGIYHGITVAVESYWPNEYGLFNMSGNVEEFVREKGITKGGSWYDTGYYLQVDSEEEYDLSYPSASDERGFRIVMEITK